MTGENFIGDNFRGQYSPDSILTLDNIVGTEFSGESGCGPIVLIESEWCLSYVLHLFFNVCQVFRNIEWFLNLSCKNTWFTNFVDITRQI